MTRERLAELLAASGVTQEELAAVTGVSGPAVNHYLSGRRRAGEIPAEFAEKAEPFLLRKAHERLRSISETVSEAVAK